MGESIELVVTPGHRVSAYRATPQEKPLGAVVVVQEIFGVNRHIRQLCNALAAAGYVAIAPSLFDRLRGGVELGYHAEDVEEGRGLRSQIRIEDALSDLRAAIKAAAAIGPAGIAGFGWGGALAWLAAARLDGLGCCVAYYPNGIQEYAEESPRTPVLIHAGRTDPLLPPRALEQIAARHPGVTVHLYEAGHAFLNEERPSFDYLSMTSSRERTIAFLRDHLAARGVAAVAG